MGYFTGKTQRIDDFYKFMEKGGEIVMSFEQGDPNAFRARLAYEKNCMEKYDRPGLPSLPCKEGENMWDFAAMYNTTVEDMKKALPAVERYLETGIL